jgi:hypothetical protein
MVVFGAIERLERRHLGHDRFRKDLLYRVAQCTPVPAASVLRSRRRSPASWSTVPAMAVELARPPRRGWPGGPVPQRPRSLVEARAPARPIRRLMRSLADAHIEQRQPILNGLKSEAGQNQTNAQDPHAPFGHVIGRPFDEGRAGADDRSDHAKG